MFQDLKIQGTIFEPGASRSETGLISGGLISAKKSFHIPKKIWKRRDKFFAFLER